MKNGLKGVTDATVFCKSMKKGGEKNQMIRSMKSYAAGGMTGTMGLQSPNAVTSESECAQWPKKPGCRKKFKSKGKSKETKGGVLGTLGVIGAGLAGYAGFKKYKESKGG